MSWLQEGQNLNLPAQTQLTGITAVSPTLAFASGYPASIMGGSAADTRRVFLYHLPDYDHQLYMPVIMR